MLRTFSLLAGLSAALLAPVFQASAAETQPLNILIMGEDADKDSVPRGNRVFNRVISAMNEELNVKGYQVFDETAVAMNINKAHRVRRRDSELIDVARAVQAPPLDVIAVFTIYASVREAAYADIKRPNVRIPGRLLNVRTGQQIGSFEVSGLELPPLPVECQRECLLEEVGKNAATLGAELADALSLKLAGFTTAPAPNALTSPSGASTAAATGDGCGSLPTAYVIRFDGFETEEVTALEEYINSFACVESARAVRASGRTAEYWYETRSDSSRLNRNLRLTLEHMGVEGQLKFAGNTFVLVKVATR